MMTDDKKKTAYNIALHYLRERILFKDYKPGDFIGEAEISQQLNISRGPVRKALFTLQTEGLAEIQSNGRTRVLGLSGNDIVDMFDLRLLLEKEAIQRILKQDFTDFSPILKTYKKMLAVLSSKANDNELAYDDKVKLVELDYYFHFCIMMLSDNRALLNAWQAVTALMKELMLQNLDLVSIEVERHKAIMDELIRKEEKCIDIVNEHLVSAKEALSRLFSD